MCFIKSIYKCALYILHKLGVILCALFCLFCVLVMCVIFGIIITSTNIKNQKRKGFKIMIKNFNASKNDTAVLLTQYERFGSIGKDEFLENFINEELEITISMLSDYNEYLLNQGYETYFSFDDLEWMLEGSSPLEVIRMCYLGNFNYNDDYLQFDGYGNLKSFSEYEVIREMKDDLDFLKWYVEKNDLIEWDEAENDISDANDLLAMGW